MIMASVETEVMQHLEHLCVEIGPRPVGSKGNQSAADYVQSVFQASGLEVEMQEFPCPAWEEKGVRLELDGETLDAAANVFQDCLAQQADHVGAANGLAVIRTKQGRLEDAERLFRRSLELAPGNAAARSGLAEVARRREDP